MKIARLVFALSLLLPSAVADTVVLQNGINLTGTIEGSDGNQLRLIYFDWTPSCNVDWQEVYLYRLQIRVGCWVSQNSQHRHDLAFVVKCMSYDVQQNKGRTA